MLGWAIERLSFGQVMDKRVLTLDGAKKVATAAAAEAKRNNEGGAIAIVDDGGNLMYLERLDDTFAAGAKISIGKARTAALFKKPTSAFEHIIKNGRTAMVALEDFTPLQGGVPILVATALGFHAFDPGRVERAFGETVWSPSANARSRELMADCDVVSRQGEIEVPTLVLGGRHDFFCPPAQAARLNRGIRGSELVIFEQSGHYPFIEEADPFRDAVRRWVAHRP